MAAWWTNFNERSRLWLYNLSASMSFFWGLALFEAIWIAWNTAAPPAMRFDPGPQFLIMLLVGNQFQLFYLPVIQATQKLLQESDERQEHYMRQALRNSADQLEMLSTLARTQIALLERLEALESANHQILNQLIKQTAEIVEELEDEHS